MKKIFMLVVALAVLCFSSVAMAASNGQLLTKEEAAVKQTMAALTGSISYDAASRYFAPELIQSMDKEKLDEMKKEVKSKLGKMGEMKLVALQKFNQGDRITYLASFTKEELVRVEFIFKIDGDQAQVVSFALVPIEQQTEQPSKQTEQK